MFRTVRNFLIILLGLSLFIAHSSQAENGYDLWLRYKKINDPVVLARYQKLLSDINVTGNSGTCGIIRSEIKLALGKMLGEGYGENSNNNSAHLLISQYKNLGTLQATFSDEEVSNVGREGYLIRSKEIEGQGKIIITANEDIGLLYGMFHLLRLMQTQQELSALSISSSPKIDLRLLDHWDNLDRTSERGYAGFSIWDWHRLPGYLDPRYTDYARANASLGINGTVLTNVNAKAEVLTPFYLEKVKALADLFRPYGIKVYLTARFSAPIELGGLKTADPLNKEVQEWWNKKINEIYSYIPDFGGFLVKANSEGQPGPQNYDRSHADGANMLADALASHNGYVMWRAFVYNNNEPDDRAKQAYNEFKPLDGKFRPNVLLQVKNGPIDFQPREPFHPLFGAMPDTPLMMEFQITQEYLGQATQWVYLAPLFKECLESDTYSQGAGSTVARVIDGSLDNYSITGIAGVANIGTDINWTGHPMAQANWYAFGRLAWDHTLTSEQIADEWIRMSFNNDSDVIAPIKKIMMESREAAVHYMTPLGLHHLMGSGHHYGPGPWISNMPRADWNPVYYHKADAMGIGFDRTETGSNAIAQYHKPVAQKFGSMKNCPEKFLLWFHHVPWDYQMSSGRTLWEELAFTYHEGVNTVTDMQEEWKKIQGKIDDERFESVRMLLDIQKSEAIWWEDASLLYFQTFSHQPLPSYIKKPEHDLDYYKSLKFPYAPGIKPQW